MQLSLDHNGFNLQRRKMYPVNPRHNLLSSVQLAWNGSIRPVPEQKSPHKQYQKAVNHLMDIHNKADRNTFRVMPVQPDSLQNELNNFTKKRSSMPQVVRVPESDRKPIQNSSLMAKSVFGYVLDYQPYKKDSYLSKVYGDRHDQYLQANPQSPPKKMHMAFGINNPILLNY